MVAIRRKKGSPRTIVAWDQIIRWDHERDWWVVKWVNPKSIATNGKIGWGKLKIRRWIYSDAPYTLSERKELATLLRELAWVAEDTSDWKSDE